MTEFYSAHNECIKGWLRLLRLVGALAGSLTIAVGRSDQSRAVRTCAAKKMELKPKPNIQLQGRRFQSRLCHTELTSGKNDVGQHW